jgi:hypothetical protein
MTLLFLIGDLFDLGSISEILGRVRSEKEVVDNPSLTCVHISAIAAPIPLIVGQQLPI